MTTDKFYVSRYRDDKPRVGYVGPMPASRAERERDAWQDAGYEARVIRATADVRKLVRKWQRESRQRNIEAGYAPR